MNNRMRQIITFEKSANILSDAITNKQIDPKHFTAAEAGLSGSACRRLKDHWGIIRVIDHMTSFIPVDEDIYRKVEINVYETCGSIDDATTIIKNACKQEIENYYNSQIAVLTAKIDMLQRDKETFIKNYLS
mgnify:FL=1